MARAALLPAGLLLASLVFPPPALAQDGDPVSRLTTRGIRMPEVPPAAPAGSRPASRTGQEPALPEPAARCVLRHAAKAAGNAEIFREIRRICSQHPGLE